MPKVIYDPTEGQYIWKGTFTERHAPKDAGWKFSARRVGLNGKTQPIWWTRDTLNAWKLSSFATPQTYKRLQKIITGLEESRAVSANVDIPNPFGSSYLGYQIAGAAFIDRRENTLLADEMGLGKTIQAAAFLNLNPGIRKVLVICPAHLKLNWERELKKWLVKKRSITIINGRKGPLPEADVTIINYNILTAYSRFLNSREWDALILDESQYIKNPDAARTKATVKIRARRKLALTGTPILNRPIELWPLLNYFDPKNWPNKFQFGKRYCGGFNNGYGWDFSGASNEAEFQEKLRSTIMIRRLKSEVLPQLPAKRRQIIELPYNGRDFKIDFFAEAAAKLEFEDEIDFEKLSEVRRELGEKKAPYVLSYLRDVLESSEKIVCFAYHTSVLTFLAEGLKQRGVLPGLVMGDTSLAKRQKCVDAFQNDPGARVFLGQIEAAGTGLTLTAASHVIFAEQDWVPGRVSQAEDRCHRIGQANSVLVQHLVFNGSLDALMARAVIRKQKIQEKALDNMTKLELDYLLE